VLSQPPLFTAQVSAEKPAVRQTPTKIQKRCSLDLLIETAYTHTDMTAKIRSHTTIYIITSVKQQETLRVVEQSGLQWYRGTKRK